MGEPTDFDGANKTLVAPKDAEGYIKAMRVFTNGRVCVSVWQLTSEEIQQIVETGRIWISVFSGGTQPPIFVGDEYSVREVVADFGPLWTKPKPERNSE